MKLSELTKKEQEQLADYRRMNHQSKLLFEIMSFSFIALRSKKDNGIELAKTKQEKLVNGKTIKSTVYTVTVMNEVGD